MVIDRIDSSPQKLALYPGEDQIYTKKRNYSPPLFRKVRQGRGRTLFLLDPFGLCSSSLDTKNFWTHLPFAIDPVTKIGFSTKRMLQLESHLVSGQYRHKRILIPCYWSASLQDECNEFLIQLLKLFGKCGQAVELCGDSQLMDLCTRWKSIDLDIEVGVHVHLHCLDEPLAHRINPRSVSVSRRILFLQKCLEAEWKVNVHALPFNFIDQPRGLKSLFFLCKDRGVDQVDIHIPKVTSESKEWIRTILQRAYPEDVDYYVNFIKYSHVLPRAKVMRQSVEFGRKEWRYWLEHFQRSSMKGKKFSVYSRKNSEDTEGGQLNLFTSV